MKRHTHAVTLYHFATELYLLRSINFLLFMLCYIRQMFYPYSGWAFSGLLTDGGSQKDPLSLKSVTHICNDETWYSYILPKEYAKNV